MSKEEQVDAALKEWRLLGDMELRADGTYGFVQRRQTCYSEALHTFVQSHPDFFTDSNAIERKMVDVSAPDDDLWPCWKNRLHVRLADLSDYAIKELNNDSM